MGPGCHAEETGRPQHLMKINAPSQSAGGKLSLCSPIVSELIPKLLISLLIYNLHFIYYPIIDFFFFPSALSHLADLLPGCTFHNICVPPFFSQLPCEKVITSVFTNFSLNTNTLKYASLPPHRTQFVVFQIVS